MKNNTKTSMKHPITLCVLIAAVALSGCTEKQSKTDRKPLADTRAKAENGDAQSQFNLGSWYAKGEGVAKDYVEAVKWYRKAAEQNSAEAQDALGV